MSSGQKLRGLVGQPMSGRKTYRDTVPNVLSLTDVTAGSALVTASTPCWALIYLQGAGASGSADVGACGGGGGGAALSKKVRLAARQSLAYAVGAPGLGVAATSDGNDGSDSTVILPNGQVLRAGGGKRGITGVGGVGGVATGGDINRPGGPGGNAGGADPGLSGGTGGGSGGLGNSGGGGGGGAGFSDLGAGFLGGAGSAGVNGGTSAAGGAAGGSGGGGGNGNSGAGGAGRVIVWLVRVSA